MGKIAFAKRAERRTRDQDEPKSVELFKLHLGNLPDHLKHDIKVEYKKAITDYLREMGKVKKILLRKFQVPSILLHFNHFGFNLPS